MVNALVLRVEGTNCDEETANALRLAGADTTLAHINDLLKGRQSLEDYQALALPGGFAHGDDIAAGVLLANQMKNLLGADVKAFVEEGKPVIGICNGFQVLVKLGLLPGIEGPMNRQEATLAFNNSGIFHDSWVHLQPQNGNKCFLNKIKSAVYLPVAHAEGRFIADDNVIRRMLDNGQVVFTYLENPNGAMRDIAGICNPQGNVFGLMPHPERFVHKWMHPQWTRGGIPDEGDGLQFFTHLVEYAKKF